MEAVELIKRTAAGRGPASVVHAVDKGISFSAAAAAILALVALFLSLGAEVVVRYLTRQSMGWPSEMPVLLFPWLVMGGVVLAAQRGAHLSVDITLHLVGPKGAKILMVIMQTVIAVTFFSLAGTGLGVVEITGSEVYPMTGVQARWAYLSLIFGFFGIGLTAVTTGARLLLGEDAWSIRSPLPEKP